MKRRLISLKKEVAKSEFLRNSFLLISGTTATQAISYLLLPVLQRWFYSPADFGVLSLYMSFSALFIACSTLKLEYAIVLPKNDERAYQILKFTLLLVCTFSVLSLACVWLFTSWIEKFAGPNYLLFCLALPFSILFGGGYEALTFWANRQKQYSLLVASKFAMTLSLESTRLIVPLFISGPLGLILGRIIGQLSSFAYLIRQFFLQRHTRSRPSVYFFYLKKYRYLPIYTLPTVFINLWTVYYTLSSFIYHFGATIAGFISISIQYVAMPLGLISGGVSQVFYQKISRIENNPHLQSFYFRIVFGLTLLVTLIIGVIYVFPEEWLTLVLGDKWKGLMKFLRLTILWQGTAFIASSVSLLYSYLMKQRLMLGLALLQLAAVYLTIEWLGDEDVYGTYSRFVLAQAGVYVFTIILGFYLVKVSDLKKL